MTERLSSISQLANQEPIPHFLSRCIRTSKRIIDFTFNTCLGTSLDSDSREKLELAMNMKKLYNESLIVDSIASDGSKWIDSRFCVFSGELVLTVR